MVETKETLAQGAEERKQETAVRKPEVETGLVDVEARLHVPENIKTWLEKIEEDPTSAKTITDDVGKPVLQPAAPKDPRIQLPVTKRSFVAGFAQKLDEAGKWLSTFILRMIKIKGGGVKFKKP